ncbi:MAG: PilZ domain-containing protein [Myxococcota bacterium]
MTWAFMVEGANAVQERRRLPRTLVSVPLSVFAGERMLLRARTVDLSPAGALLHGSPIVEVGQEVRVEVPRGASRNPLNLRAEIVRIATPNVHRRQHGVALRFTDINEIDAAILRSIIDRAARP